MTHSIITVTCPTCHKAVCWQKASRWRPFCSHRCKLIDLGEWASDTRRIAGQEAPDHEQWSEPDTYSTDQTVKH